ncbi:N-acetyltransferase family protein [Herbaspirillum sp. RTI4]|uniref:GNAT family N-acetyltransferase n=1 Tax=Herbaspirillum sp. RTI4 TaxID=3048640 RepID=UPI002AB5C354|nr:N-acetyltransferase family protein [Herbaspirillum sp. RTI4]MDY7579085.1 N-acetyltransferase family protein [Herbaspirillum sp. RTI4]MEA9981336.1 N-acetyltransferase family protein [Herbaspirillum sp. RTI4]
MIISSLAVTGRHRLATRSDLPAIVAIYNSTVASREVTADTEPVSVASREAWFDAHSPAHRPLWVVDDADGGLLGWLSFSDFYGRPAYAGTAELSIYLHQNARGQGLGRYLMQAAIAHAPVLKVHSLLGFIFGHNVASLSLFERFGFIRWGNLPNVATLDGVERDLVIMGKRLDLDLDHA